MKILFYSQFIQRSRDTESLMLAFQDQGHKVISLSQAEATFIHPYLSGKGIETVTYVLNNKNSFIYYLRHLLFLIRFCQKERVDILYSHLESANFVASVAQFFIRAKVFVCRHHIDEAALQGFDKSLLYRLTYRFAKKIIVVSNRAVKYMVEVEKIQEEKIVKINLAYDFNLYAKPDPEIVAKIRAQASAPVLLLTISRFTKYKRVELSILVLKRMLKAGIDARLILLGTGEEEQNILSLIRQVDIEERVLIPGFVSNVTDYLAAADFLLHPSVLESSCVVVKEAAITDLPVIVCHGVGDFDDYVVNGSNGFVVSKENFEVQSYDIILNFYKDKTHLSQMSDSLKKTVEDLFNIKNVISQYTDLNGYD